jgi:hypothetical protein
MAKKKVMDPAIQNARKQKLDELKAEGGYFSKYSPGVDQYGSSVKSFGRTKVLKK